MVVDASVLVPALADDGDDGQRLRSRLVSANAAAPEIIDLEVVSVLRRLVRLRRMDATRAASAVQDLRDLPLERVSPGPLIARCWELRENITPYDAAYVALADASDSLLLTADARLARAAANICDVELVELFSL